VIIDVLARLVPEVINASSPEEESFSLIQNGEFLLEYPHYTRPVEYKGEKVPDILLSGNHAAIKSWRMEQARLRTRKRKEEGDTRI
jgi:tRNA (guanine37-N1)-methyltransferase